MFKGVAKDLLGTSSCGDADASVDLSRGAFPGAGLIHCGAEPIEKRHQTHGALCWDGATLDSSWSLTVQVCLSLSFNQQATRKCHGLSIPRIPRV